MTFPTFSTTTQHLPPPPPSPSPSPLLFSAKLNPSKLRNLTLKNDKFLPPLDPKTASWTSSIAHHCKTGQLHKAIQQFTLMRLSDNEPNHITFVTLLSGCAHFPAQSSFLGRALHGYVRKLGLDIDDVMVGTAVIGMYAKFREMGFARLVFDHLAVKNKVSWNTILDGYVRNGEFDVAMEVFDEMPEKDAVSWTAIIGGFVKKGRHGEALEWFREMQSTGIEPDYVTMVSVLSAVANLGMFGLGLWFHRFVLERGFGDNIRVNNSLIDMYCRCGCVELACQVFMNMPKKSLVSWNSIIVGLSVNGHAKEALTYFDAIQNEGFVPDGVSFTGALNACSHAGLVEKGLKLFETMKQVHKIAPRIEHYGCLVDLYSRAGRLEEAFLVIKNMPMKPNEVIVGSLLAACRTCENVNMAERLINYIYDMDQGGDSNYVLLSNIYAAEGSWFCASNVRKKMKALGIHKKPGISSVEVNGTIREFMAGDKSHVETEHIYEILDHLSSQMRTLRPAEVFLIGEYDNYDWVS